MDKAKLDAGEFYIKAILEKLIKIKDEDELMEAGKQLENFLLLAGDEMVYLFAIHSWALVESFIRIDGGSMRLISSVFAVNWTTLFRHSPYPMSVACVEILENSDFEEKTHFAWFTKPVSDFLRRNIIDIAKEQLSKKR